MIIAFMIIQILLDLYFFWFIILANTAIGILHDNNPRLTTLVAVDKLKKMLDKE